MTDAAFLLAVLNDGKWHSNEEILRASFAERGCGLTIHSRAADLRKRGYTVETKSGGHGTRRVAFYRLVGALNEVPDPPAAGSGINEASSLSALLSGTSLSASIPADSTAGSASRGGALQLFDPPVRGAYTQEAAA